MNSILQVISRIKENWNISVQNESALSSSKISPVKAEAWAIYEPGDDGTKRDRTSSGSDRYFVVVDSGSNECFDTKSEIAMQGIESVLSKVELGNAQDSMRAAFDNAHHQLKATFSTKNSSVSAAALLFDLDKELNPKAYLFWVGNARIYVFEEKLWRVTCDHTYAEVVRDTRAFENKPILRRETQILTMSLGSNDYCPSFGSWEAQEGSIFLLTTDGLTSYVSDEQIAKTIRRGIEEELSLPDIGSNLMELASKNGIHEDATAFFVQVTAVEAPRTELACLLEDAKSYE